MGSFDFIITFMNENKCTLPTCSSIYVAIIICIIFWCTEFFFFEKIIYFYIDVRVFFSPEKWEKKGFKKVFYAEINTDL
jgi:hypothetical protein